MHEKWFQFSGEQWYTISHEGTPSGYWHPKLMLLSLIQVSKLNLFDFPLTLSESIPSTSREKHWNKRSQSDEALKITIEADHPIPSFYTLKMSSLSVHSSVPSGEMMRVAEFLLPSLVAGLKYRRSWRGSLKVQPLNKYTLLIILKHVCFHTDQDSNKSLALQPFP